MSLLNIVAVTSATVQFRSNTKTVVAFDVIAEKLDYIFYKYFLLMSCSNSLRCHLRCLSTSTDTLFVMSVPNIKVMVLAKILSRHNAKTVLINVKLIITI